VGTDVAAVTGNTLPFALDTPAQRVFEKHLGFWREAERWDADTEWFRSFRRRAVRTPLLGGTGNVAFRAGILVHPQIGLLEETLGTGMTGTGEDTYLCSTGCSVQGSQSRLSRRLTPGTSIDARWVH
jgi:hypothetical protein